MASLRKQIRNKVLEILRKNAVVKTENIKGNRSIPYEAKNMPAVSVYTRVDEVTGEYAEAPRLQKKEIELFIEIANSGPDDEKVADALDDIAERVETLLSQDDSLGKLVDDIVLKRIDFDWIGEEVEKPYHTALLVFVVEYNDYAPRDRANQNVTDLEGIDAEWELQPNEPDMPESDRAKDTIEPQD